MGKPIGSGRFARNVGVVFILAGLAIVALDYFKIPLRPVYLLAGWLVASGVIALRWGLRRIEIADSNDNTVGQATINMIVGMVAATFAIAVLVFGR